MPDSVLIHAKIEISTDALQTIVETAKTIVGRNAKGHFKVDTADLVSAMISRFLEAKGFEAFVGNLDNYAFLETEGD